MILVVNDENSIPEHLGLCCIRLVCVVSNALFVVKRVFLLLSGKLWITLKLYFR